MAEEGGSRGEAGSIGLVWLAAVAVALLAFYLAPYVVRGYHFAIGADAPVYAWWARLAGHDGLSATGYRPGVPALTLVAGGTMNLSPTEAVAAVGAALPVAVGLAAAGLIAAADGRRGPRGAWVLAGLFAGWYAANLADGYLASLAAAALFLASLAALASGRTPPAAVLLGAAGLCHPAFFALAVLLLLVAVAWGLLAPGGVGRGDDGGRAPRWAIGQHGRSVLGAVAGGVAVAGAGLAATLWLGPGTVAAADTSKDAFLRRAGLAGRLHALYRSRLAEGWVRYLLPLHVPLAVAGAVGGDEAAGAVGVDKARFARRVLVAWTGLTAVGVVIAVLTGLLPGERFLSFAFALPILAALGVARLWRRDAHAGGRGLRLLAAVAVAAVAVGSVLAWRHAAQFFRPGDMAAAAGASGVVAALPPGTPVVVVLDEPAHAGLDVPRWGNELRAALPPDRIRDLHLFVGSPGDFLAGRPGRGSGLRGAISRRYLADLRAAVPDAATTAVALVVRPMNLPGFTDAQRAGRRVAPGVVLLDRPGGRRVELPGPLPPLVDPVRPAPVWRIVAAAAGMLALLWAIGWGWARAFVARGITAAAIAPALGVAVTVVAGLAVDRAGLRLTGAVPVVLSACLGAGGYAVAALGRSRREPAALDR